MGFSVQVGGHCLATYPTISAGSYGGLGIAPGPVFACIRRWAFDRCPQGLKVGGDFMATVDVLLPTYNRLTSLIRTLSGVAAQTLRDLHVIVADQSDAPVENEQVVQTLRRVIESRGGSVEWHTRPQIHGITEQRDFLLKRATADAVLYLDDDVSWSRG